jgi:hypothetical protein
MRTAVKAIILWLVAILPAQICLVEAQPIMRKPRLIPVPKRIKSLIRGKIAETSTIDFNGDGIADYLVFIRNNEPETAEVLGTQVWVTSDLRIVKREPRYNAGADFKWFVNLDSDPVPEIISAFGYEGIRYSIYKQNFDNRKDTMLLQFNPVIEQVSAKGKYYWGYPWDVTDVQARPKAEYYELLCSFDHKVEGDFATIDIPRWQRWVPIIFFSGKTTQPEATVEEVGTKRFMNLEEISAKVRGRK